MRIASTLLLASVAGCAPQAATEKSAAPATNAAAPQSSAAPDARAAEGGFTPLFDGRTLTGWVGDTTGYSVESGAIVCGPKGTDLYTHNEYANFVLRFGFRLSPGANNGIGVRAPGSGDAAYEGMEIQVLDDGHEKYRGWLKPWQRHGSVYGISPSTGSTAALRPTGEWNDEEIVVDGRRVKVTLNGTVIQDVDLDQAMKAGTLSGKEHPGAKRTAGHIGFLGHGDHVEYRDIRIKVLPATTRTPS